MLLYVCGRFLCVTDKVTPTSGPVPYGSGVTRLHEVHVDRNSGLKTADPNGAAAHISSAKSAITAVAGGGAQMETCYQEYARPVYNTSC